MKISKSKRVIFSVAVAFVSVFFFAYAIQAFYPAPQYDDFCKNDPRLIYTQYNETSCISEGGTWIPYKEPLPDESLGYCDIVDTCYEEYDAVREPYERNLFFINLGIGIVVFLVAFFLALDSVSTGLMGGGVMMIIYGSIRYWSELSDVWRTLMLGVALAVLIWLGYKKIKE
jgi:hypothetical protein